MFKPLHRGWPAVSGEDPHFSQWTSFINSFLSNFKILKVWKKQIDPQKNKPTGKLPRVAVVKMFWNGIRSCFFSCKNYRSQAGLLLSVIIFWRVIFLLKKPGVWARCLYHHFCPNFSSTLKDLHQLQKINASTLKDHPNLQIAQVLSSFRSFIPPLLATPFRLTKNRWPCRLSKAIQSASTPHWGRTKKGRERGRCERAKMRDRLGRQKKTAQEKGWDVQKKLSKTVGCTIHIYITYINWNSRVDADHMMGFFWLKNKHGQKSEEKEFVTKKRCFTVVYTFAFASKIIHINAPQHDVPWDALPFQYQWQIKAHRNSLTRCDSLGDWHSGRHFRIPKMFMYGADPINEWIVSASKKVGLEERWKMRNPHRYEICGLNSHSFAYNMGYSHQNTCRGWNIPIIGFILLITTFDHGTHEFRPIFRCHLGHPWFWTYQSKPTLNTNEFTESNGDWKVLTLKPLEILQKIRTCQG